MLWAGFRNVSVAAVDKEPLLRRLLKAEAMQRVCDKLVELGFRSEVQASETLAAEAIAGFNVEHPKEIAFTRTTSNLYEITKLISHADVCICTGTANSHGGSGCT